MKAHYPEKPCLWLLAAIALSIAAFPSPVLCGTLDGLPKIELWFSPSDNPMGQSVIAPAARMQETRFDPSWIVRTGMKKDVREDGLEEEAFAGPDAAILQNGYSEEWRRLLSEFNEPSAPVDPRSLAGLAKTKPFLIVPSGALFGFARSEFFKEGLAEYVRSGGAVLCFAQRTGQDLSALPTPTGSSIDAAGWTQDSGPLFRASSVREYHPLLASIQRAAPDVETSGYLKSFPPGSRVLLSRSDGFPTFILYPYGSGWVVVTTLFPDFLYGQGRLGPEEKALVRDLVQWAKAPARTVGVSPGERLTIPVTVRGSERGEAASVKFFMVGPNGTIPASEQILPGLLKAGQSRNLAIGMQVPVSLQAGIYRIEYVLFERSGRPLDAPVECDAGGFSVGRPPLAASLDGRRPLDAVPGTVNVQPALGRAGARMKLNLEISFEPRADAAPDREIIIRAAGQEKRAILTEGTKTESFDLSDEDAGRVTSYAVYASNGRLLAAGSVPNGVPAGTVSQITPDKPLYSAGQKAVASVSGLKGGELTMTGPGFFNNQMITGSDRLELMLPADVPSGAYDVLWEHRAMNGGTNRGIFSINIAGYSAEFLGAELNEIRGRGVRTASAVVKIRSTQRLAGHMKFWLRSPSGDITPVSDSKVSLEKGIVGVPVTFSWKSCQAGIWELSYSLYVKLPDGPGFPIEPVPVASGRTLFDAGEAALLGLALDKPVHYDASGTVALTAILFGKGKTKVEVLLDGKNIKTERFDLSGTSVFTTPLPTVEAGAHKLTAVVTGNTCEHSGALTFVYGTHLPDLTAHFEQLEPKDALMSVNVSIKNTGKSASARCKAALYEGDPSRGGTLIGSADVPPLDPGNSHVSTFTYPLYQKAGTRTLSVVADVDNAVTELDERNNTATAEVKVPDLLLAVTSEQKTFTADGRTPFTVAVSNLTTHGYKDLTLALRLTDGTGKSVTTEMTALTELSAGKNVNIARSFDLSPLAPGQYRLDARLQNGAALATGSLEFSVLPTLLLRGVLDGTSASAAPCGTLSIRYSVHRAGNIPITNGSVSLEIVSSSSGQPIFARQLDLVQTDQVIKIEKIDFPPGLYAITLKASAVNQQYGITRDFKLAERPLTVSGPIALRKNTSAISRILMWAGRPGKSLDQAIAEKIVKQAFVQDDVYMKIVNNAADFTNQAKSGLFNTFILYEIDEPLKNPEWLVDRVRGGQGIVLFGAEEEIRTLAETFGFAFSGPIQIQGNSLVLTFRQDPLLGLSGTVPVSGKVFSPSKSGAQPAAVLSGTEQAAAAADRTGKGKVLVFPFSVTRSASDAGTTSLYGLLLRTAAYSVAPEHDGPGGTSAAELTVSAPAGPVKVKIVETLPAGSRVDWTNAAGVVAGDTITFEVTVEREPRKLVYVFHAVGGPASSKPTEIFYECGEKYVHQRKTE